jgi:isoquinoline 1-oxidoreductase subunit beta
MNEAPDVEVYIVSSQEPPGGTGEPGTSAVGSANAAAQNADRHQRVEAKGVMGAPDVSQEGASQS